MIHWAPIARVAGLVLAAFGGTMGIPVAYSWLTGGDDLVPLAWAMTVTAAAGGALWAISRGAKRELTRREGILLTVFLWLGASLFGALPFLLAPGTESITDAVFESASGVTTTGASILRDVETLSRPVLLWRALLSWLGGMGIVVLADRSLAARGPRGDALVPGGILGSEIRKAQAARCRDGNLLMGYLRLH